MFIEEILKRSERTLVYTNSEKEAKTFIKDIKSRYKDVEIGDDQSVDVGVPLDVVLISPYGYEDQHPEVFLCMREDTDFEEFLVLDIKDVIFDRYDITSIDQDFDLIINKKLL